MKPTFRYSNGALLTMAGALMFLIFSTYGGYAQTTPTTTTTPVESRTSTTGKTQKKPKKPSKTKDSLGKTNTNASTSLTKPAETNTTKPVQTGQTAAKPAAQSDYKPIVETTTNGKIDWTNQYIEAKGQSVIDTVRFKNKAQAKAMARRGAIVDAQRNLLEIIQGVNVVSETKVRDLIAESDFILTRIDGIVKNAQVQSEGIEKDGLIEITMRVPMYEPTGLAPALYDAVNPPGVEKEPLGDPALAANTKSASAGTAAQTGNVVAGDDKNPLNELVFDFMGKKYDPAMFPVILDENNNILLDLKKYYDPKTGKFPQIISATKELVNSLNFKEGKQIVEVIDSFNGQIKINNSKLAGKINWGKVGKWATTLGKFAMTLLVL